MATAQGDFASVEAAQAAIEKLRAQGIAASRIRKWNIIPERPAAPENRTAIGITAATGAVVGGIVGAAIGATVGAAVDALRWNHQPLPMPAGVRVVVDTDSQGPDPAEILRSCGASNVR